MAENGQASGTWRYGDGVRTFNTAGPCDPKRHYMLPPEPRVPGALYLVDLDEYFVIHAPRQTGKTTVLEALARDINATGERIALVFSCEQATAWGDDPDVIDLLLHTISQKASNLGLAPEYLPPSPWPDAPAALRLQAGLSAWSRSCPLPIVLLIDEIDALSGRVLISVLRQLRAGHNDRPGGVPFPASVVLCGMQNIRDYKAASGGNPATLVSSSPCNIIVDSLRIADFTREQIAELYAQHTAETGQEFAADAIDRVFEYTQGQPWLVNALAREITLKMRIEPPVPITFVHVNEAKDRVIRDRAPHLDSLAARLREPRVQRVIEPLIAGDDLPPLDAAYDDDVSYVEDLGLISTGVDVEVANPIYREVIVRLLTAGRRRPVTVIVPRLARSAAPLGGPSPCCVFDGYTAAGSRSAATAGSYMRALMVPRMSPALPTWAAANSSAVSRTASCSAVRSTIPAASAS